MTCFTSSFMFLPLATTNYTNSKSSRSVVVRWTFRSPNLEVVRAAKSNKRGSKRPSLCAAELVHYFHQFRTDEVFWKEGQKSFRTKVQLHRETDTWVTTTWTTENLRRQHKRHSEKTQRSFIFFNLPRGAPPWSSRVPPGQDGRSRSGCSLLRDNVS